jgi:type 1 fimbria pilin
MKLSIISAALLLAGASNVWAASSVDLSVKGLIIPAACTPTLSAGGVVDHGKISFKDLSWNLYNVLPVATLQLSVNCDAPTLVAIKGRDNRAGSSAADPIGQPNYGLGLVNGDKKLGWYLLKTANGQADGVDRPVIESNDGASWTDASYPGVVWQVGGMRALSASAGSDAAPLPVEAMTLDILIETTMVPAYLIPAGQEVPLDGSATLEVIYL